MIRPTDLCQVCTSKEGGWRNCYLNSLQIKDRRGTLPDDMPR